MRIPSWLISIPLAAVAVSFALSNRATEAFTFWPLPLTVEAPIWAAVFVGLAIGFFLGAFTVWVGRLRVGRRARREAARADRAERELAEIKAAHAPIPEPRRDPGISVAGPDTGRPAA